MTQAKDIENFLTTIEMIEKGVDTVDAVIGFMYNVRPSLSMQLINGGKFKNPSEEGYWLDKYELYIKHGFQNFWGELDERRKLNLITVSFYKIMYYNIHKSDPLDEEYFSFLEKEL